MVGENTILQLNILETGVLTLVVQNIDFVSLEMKSEPLVWEHQSPKCFGEEPTIPWLNETFYLFKHYLFIEDFTRLFMRPVAKT